MSDPIQLELQKATPTITLVLAPPSVATAEMLAAIVGEQGPPGDIGNTELTADPVLIFENALV